MVPDCGERWFLDAALSDSPPEAVKLKLYSNDYDCVEGSVAGDFTEVAAGAGYAAITLARATWNAASTATGTTSKTYADQTVTFSGTRTVVGYFIVGAVSGTLIWAERLFPSPGVVFNSPDELVVGPRIEGA